MEGETKAGYPGPEMLAIHECAHVLVWPLIVPAWKEDEKRAAEEWEHLATRIENAFKALLTEAQIKSFGG
jgi:hypothetical protein